MCLCVVTCLPDLRYAARNTVYVFLCVIQIWLWSFHDAHYARCLLHSLSSGSPNLLPSSVYPICTIVSCLCCLQSSGPLPHGAPTDLALRISALQQGPQPLVDLFNLYAAPYHQWEVCLQLVHASDGVDMAYVQQLWDLHLKQVQCLALQTFCVSRSCYLFKTVCCMS